MGGRSNHVGSLLTKMWFRVYGLGLGACWDFAICTGMMEQLLIVQILVSKFVGLSFGSRIGDV